MRLLVMLLSLFWAAPVLAEWRKAESRHFTIYSEGSEKSLRDFTIRVERFDRLMRGNLNISDADTPQKLTIYMLRTSDAVARMLGAKRGPAGFYKPNAHGSFAVVHREESGSKFALDADAVLFHEYAHHFMLRYFPVAYPAWYVEGFAEFASTTDFTKEGHAKIGIPPYWRAYGVTMEKPIPVEKMLTTTVSQLDREERDRFYGRSWMLVHYLTLSGDRTGQLSQYLRAIATGKSSTDAAKLAFGDLAQLEKDLMAYQRKSRVNYTQSARPVPEETDVKISLATPGEGATIEQRIVLGRDVPRDQMPAVIAELRTISAKFPSDPTPHLLLAEALYETEADAEVVKSADAALALAPNLSRAMLVKGRAMLRLNVKADTASAEQWKAARGWIIKANRADVNDPMPLYAYFHSFRMQGLPPTEASLTGLARAFEMVPEATDVRMDYARSLAMTKQYDAAIRLVQTVAFNPHGGPQAEWAQKMLERLVAEKAGKKPVERDLLGEPEEK